MRAVPIVIVLLLASTAQAQCRWGRCYTAPVYKPVAYKPPVTNTTTTTHQYVYQWTYQYNIANAAGGDAIPGALSYNRAPFNVGDILKDSIQVEKLQASRNAGAVEAAKEIALAEIAANENADTLNALRAMVAELKTKKGSTALTVNNDYTNDAKQSETHSSTSTGDANKDGVIKFINTYCYRCHGDDASGAKVVKGGLDLTDLAALSDERIDDIMTAAVECGGTTASGKKIPAMPPADQPQPGWRDKRFLFEVWGNRK